MNANKDQKNSADIGVDSGMGAAEAELPPRDDAGLPAFPAEGNVCARSTVSEVGGVIMYPVNQGKLAPAVGSGAVNVDGWRCCGRDTRLSDTY